MGITPCAQCGGTICLGAGANFECEYGDGWCNTRVMAFGSVVPDCGGGDSFAVQKTRLHAKLSNAEFINGCCVRSTERTENAGFTVGCVLTNIRRAGELQYTYLKDADTFAAIAAEIAKNDERDVEIRFLRYDDKSEKMEEVFARI